MRSPRETQARLRLATSEGVLVSTGYKSGRSSLLDTPESFSNERTRVAGTWPDLAHLRTDSYSIPSCLATERMPPPNSIAFETASMKPTVQPIVGFRQQRVRAFQLATLQPMVVKTKEDAKREFSKRLRTEITKRFPDAPADRGLVQWLYDLLRAHVGASRPAPVSYESCRKWLKGKEIPISPNLMLLCDATGIIVTDLMDDETRAYIEDQEDPQIATLIKTFRKLNDRGRKHVLDAAELASRAETPALEHKKAASGKKR